MSTIYANGRFLTAAPESDIPIRRGGNDLYDEEVRQLRDALVDRRGDIVQALAPRLAEKYGIPKGVHLGTRVDVTYRGKPTRSLGWLAWAVWHEGHGLNGGEYPANSPSSGCVEALVNAGLFDWDALRLFPSMAWSHHPGFQALRNACIDRMGKLPKRHRLLSEAQELHGLSNSPFPPDNGSPNSTNWLTLPVLAGRSDVVEHWFRQEGRLRLSYNYDGTTWQAAWDRLALQERHPAATPDERAAARWIVDRLETAVIEHTLGRDYGKTTPEYLREEVMSLIGWGVADSQRSDGGSPDVREAMVQSLERVLQRWPIDLTPSASHDRARLGNPWSDDGTQPLAPFAQRTLTRLERLVLTHAMADDPSPEPPPTPRRRL